MRPLSTTSSLTGGCGDYAGLATALAAHLSLTSNDPVPGVVQAGRVWGRELIVEAPIAASRTSAAKARRRVVELLRDLDFDPVADQSARSVRLRRCPLLDAAKRYPQVVCQLHLGIVRGAMDVLGGSPERTAITPFAEPGPCRLQLGPGNRTAHPADDRRRLLRPVLIGHR